MRFWNHIENAERNSLLAVGVFFFGMLVLTFPFYLVYQVLFILLDWMAPLLFSLKGEGELAKYLTVALGEHYFWITSAVYWLVIVSIVSGIFLSRFKSLTNGSDVALLVGAKKLLPGTGHLKYERLLNIVEEVAIVAGVPVPTVFILYDDAINSFSVGKSETDAVIIVYLGAIDHLTREELQGVIAHEVSHIKGGDIRQNMLLSAFLHGVFGLRWSADLSGYLLAASVLLYMIVGIFIRVGLGALGITSVFVLFWVLGAFFLIGPVGRFFGKFIQGVVHRQREYFADAMTVKLTRNPLGISNALKRIGGYEAPFAKTDLLIDEFEHALFVPIQRKRNFFTDLIHTGLDERITRLDPGWNGEYHYEDGPLTGARLLKQFHGRNSGNFEQLLRSDSRLLEDNVYGIDEAKKIISELPLILYQASKEPWSARAIIYALLLDQEEKHRAHQLAILDEHADPGVYEEVIRLNKHCRILDKRLRLPLIHMIFPSLGNLSGKQKQRFKNNVDALVEADGKVNLFEWSLRHIIVTGLGFATKYRFAKRYRNFAKLSEPISVICTLLVKTSGITDENAQVQLSKIEGMLECKGIHLIDEEEITLSKLDESIGLLNHVVPLSKPTLLKALYTLLELGSDTVEGREFFHGLTTALHCPFNLSDLSQKTALLWELPDGW